MKTTHPKTEEEVKRALTWEIENFMVMEEEGSTSVAEEWYSELRGKLESLLVELPDGFEISFSLGYNELELQVSLN